MVYEANINQPNGFDGPMTPELHLKMSKKIAQLTKVVYALNTKNDEHEAQVSCLQEAHELELKKVLGKTEDSIAKLQAFVTLQKNDEQTILELRKKIVEFESNSKDSVKEFKAFKLKTHDREEAIKREYDEHMKALKNELDILKQNYQATILEFNERTNQNDASSSMFQALKEKHDKELELLKEVAEGQRRELEEKMMELRKHFEDEKNAIAAQHREELGSMVNNEKSHLTALYKTQIAQLEEEVSTLKQVMEQSEYQSNGRVQRLTRDLEEAEAKFASFNEEKTRLEKENQDLLHEVNDLEEKFLETQRDLDIALQQVQRVEDDLANTKKAARQQAEDNMKKQGRIGELDELHQLHSVENERLQFEIKKLKDRLQEKEDEIRHLKERQNKAIHGWEDKTKQLKQDLTVKEEELVRVRAEQNLAVEEHLASAAEREAELQRQKLDEIREIRESCERQMEEVLEMSRANSAAIRDALEAEALSDKEALTKQYEAQLTELRVARDTAKKSEEELSAELTRLKNLMCSSESSLAEAEKERSDLLNNLKEKEDHLELLKSELKDKVSLLKSLRSEFDKEVTAHNISRAQTEQYAADKVTAREKELNTFWENKLKEELNELEQELTRRQSQSRNSEMKRMKDTHTQEFVEQEHLWRDKVEQLQNKIKELEKELSLLNIESLKKEMSLNAQSKTEYEVLQARITQLKEEHSDYVSQLETEHAEAMKRQAAALERDSKNLEDKLVLQHRQNIHELMKANKLSVEALKDQLDQKRMMDLNLCKQAARKEMETQLAKCRKECTDQGELRVHEVVLSYEEQKEELQRELEMRDREMKQFHTKMDSLESLLTDKQLELSRTQDEFDALQQRLTDMQTALENKSNEVMQIKQEAVMQIKKREKKLSTLHQSELKAAQSKFGKELEETAFRHQNDLEALRLEMADLRGQLLAAEERFDSRPSRPEDLVKIGELEGLIAEADERIRCLIDEKKYYELELVNRESNYNKVFKSAPKIGVMNPMNAKTKPTKKTRSDTSMRNKSSASQMANSFSSPILPNTYNTKKPTLEPISSSRSDSNDSIHTQTMGNTARPLLGPPRRVITNAFLDTTDQSVGVVVPPT